MNEDPKLGNETPVTIAASVGGSTDGTTAEPVERQGSRRRVTFMGNSYDLSALGALAGGILVLVSCLTCGQVLYCLPIVPLILGLIGLVMARDAVDERRTRLWSWIGIGGGGVALLLFVFAVLSYFAFIAFIVALSQTS